MVQKMAVTSLIPRLSRINRDIICVGFKDQKKKTVVVIKLPIERERERERKGTVHCLKGVKMNFSVK